MATNEFLKESLAHFKQQRQSKLEELQAIDVTIRQIQKQLGETPDEPDAYNLPPAAQEPKPPVTGQSAGNYKPRADEFFGMSQADAARTYLWEVLWEVGTVHEPVGDRF